MFKAHLRRDPTQDGGGLGDCNLAHWGMSITCIDFSKHPGTQFQNRLLQDFYCPIVRPLAHTIPPVAIWISQSNTTIPSSPGLVAKALNFYFCSPLPFIFCTSIAHTLVKLQLLRIGVFPINGVIFHLHSDLPSAAADVIRSADGNPTGCDFKFRMVRLTKDPPRPGQRPNSLPLNTTCCEGARPISLDPLFKDPPSAPLATTAMSEPACQLDSNYDAAYTMVHTNTTFFEHPLNASTTPCSYLEAVLRQLTSTVQPTTTTGDGDRSAYSPDAAYAGKTGNRHLNPTRDIYWPHIQTDSKPSLATYIGHKHCNSTKMLDFVKYKGKKLVKVCY